MKRMQWCFAGIALLLAAWTAQAQEPYSHPPASSYASPPLSPYLNLVRGGNAAVNYYGLVRPQIDSQRALQQLQQNAASLPSGGLSMESTPNSGHPVQFMNFSHYFSSNPAQGPIGRAPGGQAGPRR